MAMSRFIPEHIEERATQLRRDALRRWLVKDEIVFLLLHHKLVGLPMPPAVQIRPSSGTLLFYDTRVVNDFKRDGWRWQKRKDSTGRVREDRAKLVINREVVILGTYVHSADTTTFHRRSYSLRDSMQHIVLVHYFDVTKKDAANWQRQASLAHVSSGNHPCTLSSGKLESNIQGTKGASKSPSQTSDTKRERLDPMNAALTDSMDAIMTDCLQMDYLSANAERHAELGATISEDEVMANAESVVIPSFDDLLFTETLDPPDVQMDPCEPSSDRVDISDFSPDWDFVEGGAKVLICFAKNVPVHYTYGVHFGKATHVVAERVSDTVMRCTAPQGGQPGRVNFYVCKRWSESQSSGFSTHNSCVPLSVIRQFTYRPTTSISQKRSGTPRRRARPVSVKETQNDFGKRGRSGLSLDQDNRQLNPEASHELSPLSSSRQQRDFFGAVDSSTLSSFVDTALDERQCKIRVVERLSEFQKAIWTTSTGSSTYDELIDQSSATPNNNQANQQPPVSTRYQWAAEPNKEAAKSLSLETANLSDDGSGEKALFSAPSPTMGNIAPDDLTIECLSDDELEQLSEKLLERVVRQLVTVAHANDELLEELNSLDETGLSLLHYVSFYNYAQLIPLLISHGAQINQQSTQGQTSLHLAAGCGHVNVVQVLLAHGADSSTPDFDGFVAAERAEQAGHIELARLLRSQARQSAHAEELCWKMQSSADQEPVLAETDSRGTTGPPPILDHTVDATHEHNRKLLLGAFSTLSLHDKCALSLGITRDPAVASTKWRASISSDDNASFPSSVSGTPPQHNLSPLRQNFSDSPFSQGTPPHPRDGPSSLGNEPGRDNADVKSLIADDEANLTKLEAAMKLMGPEELQSLEDEAKVIQHNVRAWLLRRNCRHMRETTKKLHEATKSIQHEQQKQHQQLAERVREDNERRHMANHDRDELERAVVTVQAATRSMLARKSFLQTKNVTIKVQAATRGVLCRKHFARMKTHALASLVIQRNVLEWWNKHPGASRDLPVTSTAPSATATEETDGYVK